MITQVKNKALFLRSKLFRDYIKTVYGDLDMFQFNRKFIYYRGNNSNDHTSWVFYYSFEDSCVHLDDKRYSIEDFLEKLNKLKAFL